MNNNEKKKIVLSNSSFKEELSKVAEICDKLNVLYEKNNLLDNSNVDLVQTDSIDSEDNVVLKKIN